MIWALGNDFFLESIVFVSERFHSFLEKFPKYPDLFNPVCAGQRTNLKVIKKQGE